MARVDEGVHVPAGGDRFRGQREVFGSRTIDVKVSSLDTNGLLSTFEITDHLKGGPPRHFHHEQDEWFYVIEGEYVIEVGDERYEVQPGGSVLAPREVPHVWAHVGEGVGKQLIVLQPAGKMEEFFDALARIEGVPRREEFRRLFSSHGMEMTGPPLPVG